MTSQDSITTGSEHEDAICQAPAQPVPDDASGPKGPVDRQRWAQLIADGEIPFPTGLGADNESWLALHVAQRRRVRLIKFIARQIALHIKRNVGLTALENSHDQEQFQSE